MFDLLFIVSIIGTIVGLIKEKCEPEIPSEYWANKKLYHEDIMNGVSIEQRMENLKNGKYKLEEPLNTDKKENVIKNSRYGL